jgi:hypothetical protein
MKNYMSITEDDHNEIVATQIVMREQEVHAYQINIDNYTSMLEKLPKDDWPDSIKKLRGTTSDGWVVLPPCEKNR